jgi:hypothetical protein
MTLYKNADNLHVKFGIQEATLITGGAFNMGGTPLNVVELKVLGTAVASAGGVAGIPGRADGVMGVLVPKGAMVTKVELFAEAAVTSSGGTATLDIGLIKKDDTELDYNGLVAALDVDSATDGTGLGTIGNTITLTQGTTSNGVLLGTILTDAGYLQLNYGTEALTGGVIVVRVSYYQPHSTDGTVA